MFYGEGWIGDKFCQNMGFIKAKECNFNKENFTRELQKDDEEKIPTTEIAEGFMRYIPGYSHHYETNGYWIACEPGRGACLFYYADTGYMPKEVGGP